MDTKDYIRIESALAYLSEHAETQPALADEDLGLLTVVVGVNGRVAGGRHSHQGKRRNDDR